MKNLLGNLSCFCQCGQRECKKGYQGRESTVSAVFLRTFLLSHGGLLQLEKSARFVGAQVPRVIVFAQQDTYVHITHYLETYT